MHILRIILPVLAIFAEATSERVVHTTNEFGSSGISISTVVNGPVPVAHTPLQANSDVDARKELQSYSIARPPIILNNFGIAPVQHPRLSLEPNTQSRSQFTITSVIQPTTLSDLPQSEPKSGPESENHFNLDADLEQQPSHNSEHQPKPELEVSAEPFAAGTLLTNANEPKFRRMYSDENTTTTLMIRANQMFTATSIPLPEPELSLTASAKDNDIDALHMHLDDDDAEISDEDYSSDTDKVSLFLR